MHLCDIQNTLRVGLWQKVSYDTTFRDQTFILLNHLNINIRSFFFFVCLSDCMYVLFPCVSDSLAGDFLSAQLIYRMKDECAKRIEIIFRGRCQPRKLKSAKNNPHVF